MFDAFEQHPHDFLDFVAFLGAQLWRGAREDVENDQFFLGHIFAGVALLFLVQGAAQFQQLLKQFFNVPAAGIVGLDQLLELLGEISARLIQADQYPMGREP